MKTLFFLTTVFVSSCSFAGSCADISNKAKRLECYDVSEKSTSQPVQKPATKGAVEGLISWQYNNAQGARGDNGSKVLLINNSFKPEIAEAYLAKMFRSSGFVPDSWGDEYGVYFSKADGNGNYKITNVTPGKYALIVLSGNTVKSEDNFQSKYCKEQYGHMFDESFLNSTKRSYCTEVQVRDGQSVTSGHDFGSKYEFSK